MTNDEQEEYRLASKAAGFEITYENGCLQQIEMFRGHLPNYVDWKPKTDKGDSFDLMIACSITVTRHGNVLMIKSDGARGVVFCKYGDQDDSFMKAIFDCAVEIGRGME